MGIKSRLMLMSFMQYFVWGSWLISFGGYLIITLKFSGGQVGSIYATMGLSSLFMPGIMGLIADRWFNAERLLGISHFVGAYLLFRASMITDYGQMYWIMLLNAMFYMPTIALSNTVSYKVLEQRGFEIIKIFPPVRVWGTVGFVAAMWLVDLCKWTESPLQLYISSGASLFLGLYAFTMPACPPSKMRNKGLLSSLGLDAFVLFRKRTLTIFLIFAMLLGAALQIANAFGSAFLHDFRITYPGTFGVEHPNLLLSMSQVSETLFILAIPFFMHRFGIKKVMMISMYAWALRFGLFAIGDPGSGLWLLILSMIIYGMAFDFFNISGSLFMDKEADSGIRANAQGLFMIMTNGLGAYIGGIGGGWVIDHFTVNGVKNWQDIWFSFAAYALLLGIAFAFVFRYNHRPETLEHKHH
ncbi:MAG TPA: MFS transporter [Sphingobacteriaceae bacterium]|nr:MFS transporter [Sphingobacteriaceae bacterium]